MVRYDNRNKILYYKIILTKLILGEQIFDSDCNNEKDLLTAGFYCLSCCISFLLILVASLAMIFYRDTIVIGIKIQNFI